MSLMNDETAPREEPKLTESSPPAGSAPEEPVGAPVVDDSFTIEKGKERAAEAVDRVKQAGKTVTTQPFLDAIGSYFNRAVDALIGLADGAEGKAKKKDPD